MILYLKHILFNVNSKITSLIRWRVSGNKGTWMDIKSKKNSLNNIKFLKLSISPQLFISLLNF